MKIFHIVSNKAWGGGEQYVFDLCQRQLADGISVAVFCKPVESVISKFRQAGITAMPLSLGGALDVKSAWQMAAVVRRAGACTIHAHNFKDAFTACYARRLAFGCSVRVVMCRHLTRKGKDSWLYRWLYGQLDCLCFDSELSKSMFLSTWGQEAEGHRPASLQALVPKMRVVRTSIVVPAEVTSAGVRQRYDIANQEVVGMYHGRLDPEKGLDTLLEAVAVVRAKPLRLVLVGSGSDDYTAHLKQKAAQLNIADRVVFAGFQHPVLPFVADADFGILASTVREGCPLSPQEYMSQGHAVVVTDNGGQREYVTDGKNGLLVSPGDTVALATAMARLIDDDTLRQQLGAQAKADFLDHLSYEHFYEKIKTIYSEQNIFY